MNPGALESSIDDLLSRSRRKRIRRYSVYFVLFLAVAWSVAILLVVNTDWERILGTPIGETIFHFLNVDFGLIPNLLKPAWDTLLMATLGTVLGLVMAIPVAWLGARNISPLPLVSYPFGRLLMTLSRSIHEIVWALIFVSAVGLGALAGILAMAMRSIGFVSKTGAEAIEDIDYGPVDAIKSVGASKFQILIFAIAPQVIPVFLGNTIFEWDINIRRATIMGLVGAGGLGFSLFRQMALFNYGGMTSVVLVVFVLIGIGEVISRYVRKKVI